MATHWECSCGARWDRWLIQITIHIREGRAKGEEHNLKGLMDDETGEILAMTVRQAVDKGLMPRATKGPRCTRRPGVRASTRHRYVEAVITATDRYSRSIEQAFKVYEQYLEAAKIANQEGENDADSTG